MSLTWLLVIFCIISVRVDGWGQAGHSIIARLAQSQLTGDAVHRIRNLIPWHWNGNLSSMASWADDILYPDANPTGYPNWQWTRPLHYINTPDWSCNYRLERDCIDDVCAEGAIRNYTKRLETNLDDIQHQEALYFLIHYVGDIHQPLHTSFINDRGGNRVQGRFMNGTYQTNLHSLWDSGLLTTRLRRDFQSNIALYYEHIYQIMLQQPSSDNDDDMEKWINENINIVCTTIYLDEENNRMNSSTNFRLGEGYYQRHIPIIEQRLAIGGRRLGALLNRLKYTPSKITTEVKLSLLTYILIGVIVFELIIIIAMGIICCIQCRRK